MEDAKKVMIIILIIIQECEDKSEEFNLELWNEEFNTKNGPIITFVPEKLQYEIDDDFFIDVPQN